jgi:CRP/FNR family transcriptional regulator, cyclic AMP receptor protein
MRVTQAATPLFAERAASPARTNFLCQQIAAHAMQTRHYCGQRVIYREGDAGNAVYAVLAGHLKAECWGTNGKAMLVQVLGYGDIFGELSLLDGHARGATVTSINHATLAILSRQGFNELLATSPAVAQHLLEMMSVRLRKLAKRCEAQSSAELSSRLAEAILDLTRQHGRAECGGPKQIPFPLSQHELGNLVGASRESVNKVLRGWSQLGVLTHKDGVLRILDEQALGCLAPAPGG